MTTSADDTWVAIRSLAITGVSGAARRAHATREVVLRHAEQVPEFDYEVQETHPGAKLS